MALGGKDGQQAGKLLRAAIREGAAALEDIIGTAVKRLLARPGGGMRTARELFDAKETKALAEALAATNATAELLGRSRIRLRQAQAEARMGSSAFSEEPTSFEVFDDRPLSPMVPEKAFEYFRSLVPTVAGDTTAAQFAAGARRTAFTLANVTEQTVLERVKAVISGFLETGEQLDDSWRSVRRILDEGGFSSRNPQYAEMVFRTNLKDAYNVGADEERQDPDVAEAFPVWKYSAVAGPQGDGRNRPEHLKKHGLYFPNDVTFADVRDSEGESPWNCRCDQIPIHSSEWAELQKAGARVERWPR